MISTCKELGIEEFMIVTSSPSKRFLCKMGAVYKGEVESLIKEGRNIPQFVYIV